MLLGFDQVAVVDRTDAVGRVLVVVLVMLLVDQLAASVVAHHHGDGSAIRVIGGRSRIQMIGQTAAGQRLLLLALVAVDVVLAQVVVVAGMAG